MAKNRKIIRRAGEIATKLHTFGQQIIFCAPKFLSTDFYIENEHKEDGKCSTQAAIFSTTILDRKQKDFKGQKIGAKIGAFWLAL